MGKTLILWPDETEDFAKKIATNYPELVDVKTLYRQVNKPLRALRKLLSYLNLSTELFTANWTDDINNYDRIIIDANIINRTIPKVIRKKGYKGRIIYWYWNPVLNCVNPNKINKELCELWSFSKDDCKNYDLKYNTTYYIPDISINNRHTNTSIDFFFIGRDKGRYLRLRKLEKKLAEMGFICDFRIIRDSTSSNTGKYQSFLSYSKIQQLIQSSKILVEFLQEKQCGLSLRTMEAIYYGKKIITDSTFIRDEPFYSPKRILIYDNFTTEQDIKNFFFEEIHEDDILKWRNFYSFPEWLNRFK